MKIGIGIRYLKGTPPEIELSFEIGSRVRKWRIAIARYFRLVTLKQYVSKEDGCLYQRWDKYQSEEARREKGGTKFHEYVSYKSYICSEKTKTESMS
jgi:hypothetical protein